MRRRQGVVLSSRRRRRCVRRRRPPLEFGLDRLPLFPALLQHRRRPAVPRLPDAEGGGAAAALGAGRQQVAHVRQRALGRLAGGWGGRRAEACLQHSPHTLCCPSLPSPLPTATGPSTACWRPPSARWRSRCTGAEQRMGAAGRWLSTAPPTLPCSQPLSLHPSLLRLLFLNPMQGALLPRLQAGLPGLVRIMNGARTKDRGSSRAAAAGVLRRLLCLPACVALPHPVTAPRIPSSLRLHRIPAGCSRRRTRARGASTARACARCCTRGSPPSTRSSPACCTRW